MEMNDDDDDAAVNPRPQPPAPAEDREMLACAWSANERATADTGNRHKLKCRANKLLYNFLT